MGREFRVNSYRADFQKNPDITVLADGSYIVVWDSYYGGSATVSPVTYVAAQRFSADDRPLGNERVVFARPDTASKFASVTALKDGGYVVLWTYDDYGPILTTASQVYAQVYNADGSVRASAFRVDQTPDRAAGGASAFATDTGFIVTFSVYQAPYSDVYQRRYDADGDALAPQMRVNTVVNDNNQFYAVSETLSDGRVLVAWSSVSTFDAGASFRNEVRGTIRASDGSVVQADFHLTTDFGTTRQEAGGLGIASLRGGGFAVSHVEYSPGEGFGQAVYVDRFMATGQQRGAFLAHVTGEIIIDSEVVQLASGQIAVVWVQFSESASNLGKDVMARVFSSEGRALTHAFMVSTDRSSTDDQGAMNVAALPGGGFVVTYQSDSIDGDEEGIAARSFGRGTAGDDVLTVDQSGTMAGLAGRDAITGNARANALSGGAGLDTLTGGAGADQFVFARPDGVDKITDFGGNDVIVLAAEGFGLAAGPLAAQSFAVIGEGITGADRILYNQASGALFYDANGSAPGGRVQFAAVQAGSMLTAADFLVF